MPDKDPFAQADKLRKIRKDGEKIIKDECAKLRKRLAELQKQAEQKTAKVYRRCARCGVLITADTSLKFMGHCESCGEMLGIISNTHPG